MKLTAYILILALFLASVGMSLFFFPELNHIRKNVQKQLEEKGNRVELVFTKDAYARLDWTRSGKEFDYHGKMYDVASIKTKGNRVMIVCLFDKKETGLRQKLKDFFSSSPNKNLPLQTTVKVLSQKYFTTELLALSLLFNFRILMYKPYIFSLQLFENGLTDPPPKA